MAIPPLVEGPLGASEWRDTRRTALEKITVSTFSQGVAVKTPSSKANCVAILTGNSCSITLVQEVPGDRLEGSPGSHVATPFRRDRWTSQCGKSLWRPSGCCRGQRQSWTSQCGKSLWRPSGCSRGQRHDQPTLGAAAASHKADQALTSGDPT